MPKTYTVTEYDKDDIEALDSMSKSDVIETLEHIKEVGFRRTMCVPREIMKHITKVSTIPLSCTLQ